MPNAAAAATFLAVIVAGAVRADEPVSFNRDIRPILSAKCFRCHGPDANARQADLRLDLAADATQSRDSGAAIVPGNLRESRLYQRVTAPDPAERMPPPEERHQLTGDEIDLLGRWIEKGAVYEPHWALVPPKRLPPPAVQHEDWTRNAIDAFVLARLEAAGLEPLPEADRATLIRRVTLDLRGLPPTPDEIDAFLADESPNSYEQLVDRLLGSPHYGERMAQVWLDVARYADSGGYQGDILRVMWPWRDWVIRAYNANMPFDQFTVEQLAGDLLPRATHEQRIATGFNRNHRINDEDGIIHEEFRVEYVVDRVETTASAWMGLTLGCARCHDHKYDLISQREFYGVYAYFNSVDESGRGHGNAPPLLPVPTREQQARLAELDRQIANANGDAGIIEALNKQRADVESSVIKLMVMQDLAQPRETFVLVRGAYDQPGERVDAGVPAALPALAPDAPANRLSLARWLVDPQHPLTSRVTVNRLWQMLFGSGLVETQEDFGTQGTPPTHPDLLDWLATELIRTGWDIKAMQRLIVTSATYRQSSQATRDRYEQDPQNRLLSRGPRFRMPAELLRDQALAASGLLVQMIGGPSVRPYQPEGLWAELASNDLEYNQGNGADLYRRSMYTFLRRTIAPPSMMALDMPNREICTARRQRTNTPVQALVLMNDPTYVEAARALAERVLLEERSTDEERVTLVFRRVLSRKPAEAELNVLLETLRGSRERFSNAPDRAREFIAVGDSVVEPTLDPVEVAALASVANMVLNLDEALTRE